MDKLMPVNGGYSTAQKIKKAGSSSTPGFKQPDKKGVRVVSLGSAGTGNVRRRTFRSQLLRVKWSGESRSACTGSAREGWLLRLGQITPFRRLLYGGNYPGYLETWVQPMLPFGC